jgi:nitrite reductase/ring-hydroxylating ferredoxin subunit
MTDPVRITLEGDDDSTAVRVYDDEGDVSTDDATFRFSIDGGREGDANGDDTDGNADSRDASADTDPRRIAPLEDVPTNGTLRCEARRDRRGTELILRREGTDVSAWRNSCPHKPEVRIDPGSGAIVRDDQLVCHEHGARFECGDGVCTAGPCRGDALDPIAVAVRDGTVYLSDDRFDSCRRLDDPAEC